MAMSQNEIDELMKSGEIDEETLEQDENDDKNSSDEKSSESNDYSKMDPKLELLYDLELPVSIELGRTNMLIRDILKLGRGSVVEFDKLVSEPVNVMVNNKKVAEGEVVVVDKHFGIRITTLVDPSDRLKGLKK